MSKCNTCGHHSSDNYNFCGECGTALRKECPICHRMEPLKFVAAGICKAKAKKKLDGFRKQETTTAWILALLPLIFIGLIFCTGFLPQPAIPAAFVALVVAWLVSSACLTKKRDAEVKKALKEKHPDIADFFNE